MTAVAALESGQAPSRPTGPDGLTLAAYVAGGAILAASFALLAAFYNLRHGAAVWPPEHAEFDEYFSVMLSATLLLSAGTAAWATSAATAGNRRQALGALLITVGFGGAFLNLAWYTGAHSGFGPSSHPFGTVVIAGLVVGAVAVAIGIVALLAATLATQFRASATAVNAAARFWFLVVAAWMVSPVALYGLMSAK